MMITLSSSSTRPPITRFYLLSVILFVIGTTHDNQNVAVLAASSIRGGNRRALRGSLAQKKHTSAAAGAAAAADNNESIIPVAEVEGTKSSSSTYRNPHHYRPRRLKEETNKNERDKQTKNASNKEGNRKITAENNGYNDNSAATLLSGRVEGDRVVVSSPTVSLTAAPVVTTITDRATNAAGYDDGSWVEREGVPVPASAPIRPWWWGGEPVPVPVVVTSPTVAPVSVSAPTPKVEEGQVEDAITVTSTSFSSGCLVESDNLARCIADSGGGGLAICKSCIKSATKLPTASNFALNACVDQSNMCNGCSREAAFYFNCYQNPRASQAIGSSSSSSSQQAVPVPVPVPVPATPYPIFAPVVVAPVAALTAAPVYVVVPVVSPTAAPVFTPVVSPTTAPVQLVVAEASVAVSSSGSGSSCATESEELAGCIDSSGGGGVALCTSCLKSASKLPNSSNYALNACVEQPNMCNGCSRESARYFTCFQNPTTSTSSGVGATTVIEEAAIQPIPAPVPAPIPVPQPWVYPDEPLPAYVPRTPAPVPAPVPVPQPWVYPDEPLPAYVPRTPAPVPAPAPAPVPQPWVYPDEPLPAYVPRTPAPVPVPVPVPVAVLDEGSVEDKGNTIITTPLTTITSSSSGSCSLESDDLEQCIIESQRNGPSGAGIEICRNCIKAATKLPASSNFALNSCVEQSNICNGCSREAAYYFNCFKDPITGKGTTTTTTTEEAAISTPPITPSIAVQVPESSAAFEFGRTPDDPNIGGSASVVVLGPDFENEASSSSEDTLWVDEAAIPISIVTTPTSSWSERFDFACDDEATRLDACTSTKGVGKSCKTCIKAATQLPNSSTFAVDSCIDNTNYCYSCDDAARQYYECGKNVE